MRFNTLRINSGYVSKSRSFSKKKLGSGTTTLIISNEKIDNIMKVVKSLQEAKQKTKKCISQHFIRHLKHQFIRKYVSEKRCIKS